MFSWLKKKKFLNLVAEAYENPTGSARAEIQQHAQQLLGLVRSQDLKNNRKYLHSIGKAMREISLQAQAQSAPDLGHWPIGFEDIQIECFKTDANTASVYLYGLSDNLPIFHVYRRFLAEGSVTIDVGANIGMHTMAMAKLVGDGHVYAYEPSPSVHARLVRNIDINNLENITCKQKALGASEGEIGFVDCAGQANIGISHVDVHSESKVAVTTLDREFLHVANVTLIKLDVEGHELEALKGGRQLLVRDKPALVVEVNRSAYSLQELLAVIPYPVDVYLLADDVNESDQRLDLLNEDSLPSSFNALLVAKI